MKIDGRNVDEWSTPVVVVGDASGHWFPPWLASVYRTVVPHLARDQALEDWERLHGLMSHPGWGCDAYLGGDVLLELEAEIVRLQQDDGPVHGLVDDIDRDFYQDGAGDA